MNKDTQLQSGRDNDEPLPASNEPLSPGRTNLNPSDQAGVDELPDNDGEVPLNTNDEAPVLEEMPDVDVANAEMDEQPNPR